MFNLDFHEMQDVHELYIKSFIDRKPNCGNMLHTRNQVINFALRMYSFGKHQFSYLFHPGNVNLIKGSSLNLLELQTF